jgi:hypothetical protein
MVVLPGEQGKGSTYFHGTFRPLKDILWVEACSESDAAHEAPNTPGSA